MSIKDVLQILDKEEEFVFNNEQIFLSRFFEENHKCELISVCFSSSSVHFTFWHPEASVMSSAEPIKDYIKWREEVYETNT